MSDLGSRTINERTIPAVVYALYLLVFVTGITAIIGLIIAYTQRDSASASARTHYTFQIRTFWLAITWLLIGGTLAVVGALLAVILIGVPILMVGTAILALVSVWWAVRCVVGVVFLARGEPYPRPDTWLA